LFTGIIKALGVVDRIQRHGGSFRYSIQSKDLPWRDYAPGDSISVNGVCLTAVELRDDGFDCDVSSETSEVTTMLELNEGARVNLEPALSIGDRLGGHLVSGHVDCVGAVLERHEESGSIRLRISLAAEYLRYTVKKGSICVDGVSLTINEVSNDSFSVNIIPHTANETIAGSYKAGACVNIEVDQVARYLEGLLLARDGLDGKGSPAESESPVGGITKDFLRAHGYA
jgi:riboflavin synthase